jgi:protein required for attachment to host cells
MSTTWILVANASRARLFENTGINKGLRLVSEFEHPASRMKGVDLVSDRPGHSPRSGNSQGARQPAIDPKQNEAEHFAKDIANTLEMGRGQNGYERLIVAAAAPFLGVLKKHLSEGVSSLMSDSVNKDLTQVPLQELGSKFEHCIYL